MSQYLISDPIETKCAEPKQISSHTCFETIIPNDVSRYAEVIIIYCMRNCVNIEYYRNQCFYL